MRWFLFFLFAGVCCAAPTITCPTVLPGGTVTCTSTSAGNWTIPTGSTATFSGSVTGVSSVTVVAPAGPIYALHSEYGCPVSPNDSIYNTPISALPTDSRSATWLSGTLPVILTNATISGYDSTWEPNVISNSTNTISNPTYLYTSYLNGISIPMILPPNRKRETGSVAGGSFDSHMVQVNSQNCNWTETYHDYFGYGPQNNPPTTANSGWAYTGYNYPAANQGATDAAGLCLECITLQYDELASGTIHHALRFTLAGGYIQPENGGCTYCAPLWPSAIGSTGAATCGYTESQCTGNPPPYPPYGARIRLSSSYTVSGTCGTECTTLINTLKTYGMFLADASYSYFRLQIGQTIYAHPDAITALNQLVALNIPVSDLQVVDESSFATNATTANAPAQAITSPYIVAYPGSGQAGSVVASQTYVTPSNSMMIAETVSGTTTYYPVSLVPISIGFQDQYPIVVGGYSYTPTLIKNGTTATPTYAIASCSAGTGNCGTFSSAGVYTAPSMSCGTESTATLTATVGSAVAYIYMTIVAAPSASCTLAFGPGNSSAITMTTGTVILPQPFARYAQTIYQTNYPGPISDWTYGPPGNTPITDHLTFQNIVSCPADCVIGPIFGLSGNYDVTSWWGQGSNGSGGSPCNSEFGMWSTDAYPTDYHYMWLDMNGVLTHHQYSPPVDVQYQCYVPHSLTDALLTVSGQPSYIAYRSSADQGNEYNSSAAELTRVSIVPDTTSPASLTIDTQQVTQLAPNGTATLWDVPQFISGYNYNNTTWSILSGPGTISSTCQFSGWCYATYTAPSSQTVTSPVVIQAANGSYTATATLYVTGSQVSFF